MIQLEHSGGEAVSERSRYAGKVIGDDDAAIAAALEDVSIPALIMSMVHITGDPAWIRGEDVPAGNYLNEVQGFMDPESQQRVRDAACTAIAEWRDAGCPLPEQPGPELLHEMMNTLVGEEVPSEYVPLLLEELELDGHDAREVDLSGVDADSRRSFHVVVIGAGMSGILAGIQLAEAGISYTVVEKNPAVGGTWYENQYPGCRVDVGNHFYCYSFEPSEHWSEFFSQQPELQRYFEDTARRHDVLRHIRFDTEVTAATFNEDEGKWTVDLTGPEGAEQLVADAVISAVGQLNRPKLPDIEGVDSFGGEWMHSAQWRHDVDIDDKRVAVIGTGASAFQLVPSIAERVGHLSVFQRSAPWMFENPNYHEKVGPGVRWALEHLPWYGRWFRFLIFWPACDGGMIAMRIDPDYPHQDRAISEANDGAREFFSMWIRSQCGDDEELAAKVVPDYVCLGTRTLQDNGSWIGALRRDDVDLVTDSIARIEHDAVVTVDGEGNEERHEVDVIVYATGFAANKYLWPMRIEGRGGAVLSEQWGEEPTALYGVSVPNFPNLFCIYGPGTNLASGGSLIFHSECEMRYIMGCLKLLLSDPEAGAIEVTPEAHDEYNARLQEEMSHMVWSHPSVKHSWYRNEAGDIYILSPWRLVDFWNWTREPDPAHYVLS